MFRHNRIDARRRFLFVATAAISPLLVAPSVARAGGNFDGGQTTAGVRLWDVGGVNPGINWDLDSLPLPTQSIVFDTCGDGGVDLNGAARSHPSFFFKDWVSYTLSNGTIDFSTAAGGAINVGGSVGDTYGSSYFADGTVIATKLDLGPAAAASTIAFTHNTSGILNLSGPLVGSGSLRLFRIAGASNTRAVYFGNTNAGYNGAVTIGEGTAARLLSAGRTGTGSITLQQGGRLVIQSDTVGGETLNNSVFSSDGIIRADHNYTLNPAPAFAPGTVHRIGGPGAPVVVDNPGFLGGTSDAIVRFNADNGYNFQLNSIRLDNAGGAAMPFTRTVVVQNGQRTTGYAGSILQTSVNRLNEMVVTTTLGTGAAAPTIFDLDPVTLAGITLTKRGTGVLAVNGNNNASSTGQKQIFEGVIRFNNANAYGAGPAPVILMGGAGPVSAGMGVGYATPIPANLFTTGAIPGQSGAFDIDTVSAAPFFPALGGTALRLGSSGAGTITGGVGAFNNAGTSNYYLGGGGGRLIIGGAGFFAPAFPGATTIEMGTTGKLLPGRVDITVPVVFGGGPTGIVQIHAGTLGIPAPGILPAMIATRLGAYSPNLDTSAAYTGAPAGTPYDGPGQLLLDTATQVGGFYVYGGGGSFGAAGLILDGGAVGYGPGAGAVPIPVLPGIYGATLQSTLYQSMAVAPAPVPTNILHLGGENSTGTMVPGFPINNNGATPVALLKSGVDSVLDLTTIAANGYTGGTGILGGELRVTNNPQLGPPNGALVIADGGILHIVAPPGPPVTVPFPRVLRVANGPEARASIVNVDFGGGPVPNVAQFSFANFEAAAPGSILEKDGGGTLELLPGFIYPTTAFNQNSWGIKATKGLVRTNQLPGIFGPDNGSAVFDGGTLELVGSGDPGFVFIPAATQFHPNYGYGGLQSYANTDSTLRVGDRAFFRVTGAQTSALMGKLNVNLGAASVFKIADDSAGLGAETRGTGQVNFSGGGFVQFTPNATSILWPRDGGFTMTMNFMAQFSGCTAADFNGNLFFNDQAGSPLVTIDAATVNNAPAAANSTWTIGGTGATNWAGIVVKGRTEAIPGSGGPYVSGVVNLNRCLGATVSITPGALLDIQYGALNAGDTGDPFTDTTTSAHLPINNNANFNIVAGSKHVASISGAGTTTVSAGAKLDVGSSGPVTQGIFTVNGTADVGNINVSGTTGVGPAPADLSANYVRGGPMAIMSGHALIKTNGGVSGVSNVDTLAIGVGGQMDMRDNDIVVRNSPVGVAIAGTYNGISGLIQSGYDFGSWTGDGLITSTADAASGLTTLGIGYSGDILGIIPTDTALWQGQTVDGDSTLVMYTYAGDANLDGTIDGGDYGIIDNFVQIPGASGYQNGDFNYDGVIDGGDYGIIDNNIQAQGAPLSNSATVVTGVTPVPEPVSLALPLLAASALYRRRRKH